MSANFGSSGSQEIDLNITPIIDCFTVLITFLLASASFISIGFFEAYTPGNTADPVAAEPDTEVVIKLKENHIAELKLKGKRNESYRFDLSKPDSVKTMQNELEALKNPSLKLNQVLVSADDNVDYQALSEVMGQLHHANLPVVVGEF